MIGDVDRTLSALLDAEVDGVPVTFEAPTRDWAAKQPRPGVNLYLYDVREDLKRREAGRIERRDDRTVVARRPPARHFRLSYLVTAWTSPPVDEHELLSDVLVCLLGHDVLPTAHLKGRLHDLDRPVPLAIALPPTEDRSFADVWSALGGELRPSLDVVVTLPVYGRVAEVLARRPESTEVRVHDVDAGGPRSRGGDVPADPRSRRVRRWAVREPAGAPDGSAAQERPDDR